LARKTKPGKTAHELALEYVTLHDDPRSKLFGNWKEEIVNRLDEIWDEMQDKHESPARAINEMRDVLKLVIPS
jgi:hypothetical protein